jgi:hypothetical protein
MTLIQPVKKCYIAGMWDWVAYYSWVKTACVALFVFILVNAAFQRAGLSWEVSRSRESFSSRETYRTFTTAFWTLAFLVSFVLIWNYNIPSQTVLLTHQSFSQESLLPALGAIIVASLLPTLGARLGCRFSKKGCQYFAALGYLLGIAILAGSAVLLGGVT